MIDFAMLRYEFPNTPFTECYFIFKVCQYYKPTDQRVITNLIHRINQLAYRFIVERDKNRKCRLKLIKYISDFSDSKLPKPFTLSQVHEIEGIIVEMKKYRMVIERINMLTRHNSRILCQAVQHLVGEF